MAEFMDEKCFQNAFRIMKAPIIHGESLYSIFGRDPAGKIKPEKFIRKEGQGSTYGGSAKWAPSVQSRVFAHA